MFEHDGAMMIDEDDNIEIEIDTPVIWGKQEIKVIVKKGIKWFDDLLWHDFFLNHMSVSLLLV